MDIALSLFKALANRIEDLLVGRLINPGSERSTKRWADEHSGIFLLCGNPGAQSLNAWYRAVDALYACKLATMGMEIPVTGIPSNPFLLLITDFPYWNEIRLLFGELGLSSKLNTLNA